MPSPIPALLAVSTSGLMLLAASTASAEQTRVRVTIENVAPQQATFVTPVWIGLHDGVGFDTYNGGTPADSRPLAGSRAMEALCEDGNNTPISDDFTQLQPLGLQAVLPGPNGPIAPGDITSASFIVDNLDPATRYFTYASMVIPSNDFCLSNGNPQAHPLFDDNGDWVAQSFFVSGAETLDAGTEINDELPENTAFFGQQNPDTGEVENGLIGTLGSDRPGISGFLPRGSGGILDAARFREGDFSQPGYSFLKFTFSQAPAITGELNFTTTATGAQEVPANNSRARAIANLALSDDGSRLLVDVDLRRGPRELQMAHLHLGAAGTNGPVVVDLLSKATLDTRGNRLFGFSIELDADDLTGPLQGQPLDRLSQAIIDGDVYLNLHTTDFPAGEVRGQLEQGQGLRISDFL
ncbi:MAG: hypothetical protein Tsb002_10000 [Wenzhouxiangellaceae bacterium]